jgi:hypothetical protein
MQQRRRSIQKRWPQARKYVGCNAAIARKPHCWAGTQAHIGPMHVIRPIVFWCPKFGVVPTMRSLLHYVIVNRLCTANLRTFI